MDKKLIIGITGASGIAYGIKLLELLREAGVETHLIVSAAGHKTREFETKVSRLELHAMADRVYSNQDIAAAVSSGSFQVDGMIIAPCSMRTLAEIAYGTTANLISRAADVMLKERRRLVLLTRETPLHQGHIENMLKVTQMGGIIAPPVPAFYTEPKSIDDLVTHTAGRVLDLFDIQCDAINRWCSSSSAA